MTLETLAVIAAICATPQLDKQLTCNAALVDCTNEQIIKLLPGDTPADRLADTALAICVKRSHDGIGGEER